MRVYDGSQWIAASAASQAILTKYKYVATAGQTTFSGTDANSLTLTYTVGSIIVTLNGVVLNGTDYTATTGTSVVLSVAASLNDELNVHAFSTFDVANTYTQAQVDAFAVKLTGDQTVAGVKTFSGATTVMNGNVGIGITPPTNAGLFKWLLVDGVNIGGVSGEGGIFGNAYYNTNTSSYKYINSNAASRIYLSAAGAIKFDTAPSGTAGNNITFTESVRIDSSGNLLVGATAVTNVAKVGSYFNGATQNGIVSNDTSSSSGTSFFVCSNNGILIGNIARVGATSAVVYNTTSDQRLKSNIEDAAPVLEKLMDVKVRQYDWTEGDLHQDYGFVAQELEPLLSGIVTKGKTEEDIWQLDYSRLTPHLVKAIQEQQALITQQAAALTTLTERITALENKQ